MERLFLIVREAMNDDSYGSIDKDIKVCGSIEEGNSIILDELNEGFETNCKSLAEMACLLADSGIRAGCAGHDTEEFYWEDNGKGENYKIINLDLSNAGWQKL